MEIKMGEKSYLKSKTLWFNALTSVLAVLSLADIQAFLPAKYVALINAIGNIILRVWFTNTTLK